MASSPFLTVLMLFGGAYVCKLWIEDYRAQLRGEIIRGGLPGATPSSRPMVIVAIGGSLLILAAETWGELRLGLSEEQSEITVLFGCYTLMAAVIEEIIFRGFLVVPDRGPVLKWAAVLSASLIFAAIHPFLWLWEDGVWTWTLTPKGWFSTGAVFLSSLWFYTVRFLPGNPTQSLIPCFAAHAAKNLGVFAIKGVQGFVVGWW
jgi:membrane protease YdiL (CAAX protease family)